MILNFGLVEHHEFRAIFGYNSHLDLARLEVCREYGRETVDSQLDGLVVRVICKGKDRFLSTCIEVVGPRNHPIH